MPVGETRIFRFGPFELDTQCRQLRKDGVGLKLQGQPVQILEILLAKPGQLVTREELRGQLWASDTFVDFDHSLNTAMKKLRQAMGDEADMPRYIETLPRRGYRFIGEVERESAQEEDGEAGAALPISRVAQETQIDDRPRVRWKLAVVISAVVVLTIAAAGGVYEIVKPLPLPRIIGSHALTHTGYRKVWDEGQGIDQRLLTDGQKIFFQENRPSGVETMQVSRAGGEVSKVVTSPPDLGTLRDISKDGFEILDSVFDPKTFTFDAWVHPSTGGPGRLIVKDAKSPRWSADGRTVLFARNGEKYLPHNKNLFQNKSLYRINSDGTDVHRLAELPDINLLAVSPDGRRIRFMAQPGFLLWEANSDGSNTHPVLPSQQGRKMMGDWSPDGKNFFFTRWSGDRWDLWVLPETKSPWKRVSQPVQLTFGPMSVVSPTVSKDGKQLYAVALERHGELAVYDRKAAKFIPYMSGLPACYVDFSRDGQWIAYVSYPGGNLWRSRIDGSERRQLTAPPMAVINPRWSPDGKLIAFMDLANGDRQQMSPSTPRRIFVVSADGGGPMLLVGGSAGDPTWSPDDRAIAYAIRLSDGHDELQILDLASMTSTTLTGSQNVFSPRWSPDGKYLAAMDIGHSKLEIYSFASKTWTDVFEAIGLNWPSWSRDSKSIYLEASDVQDVGDFLVRIGIEDLTTEVIAPINDVRDTAYYFWNVGWFGLTPDDRPLTTLDTGIEEIYAFDLEYK